MASLQAKIHNGQKYWCIVESKRINGKPRSQVIAYLGTADTMLEKLQSQDVRKKVKSASHGGVAALLEMAKKLNVVSIINKHTASLKDYRAAKPIRNDITVGLTLLLAAIGRVCEPTSKMSWHEWAKETTCSHLLRICVNDLDSQHFWDMMDCIPEKAIAEIELEILKNVIELYPVEEGTLLYDTTNFYTFIDSSNDRCDIAQRGKNKQKRGDLRQIGLALAVTRDNYIPLIHHTYQGNMSDCKVFTKMMSSIKERMIKLNMDIDSHTIVFDRGCNSKDNLKRVKNLNLHYVGALTPSHHIDLITSAEGNYIPLQAEGMDLEVYREKKEIWGEERTVLVFISQRLKDGQIRGIYQMLEKQKKRLRELQKSLANPRAKKRSEKEIENAIEGILEGQFMKGLIETSLTGSPEKGWTLTFRSCRKKIESLEDKLGFRIIMTDHHNWESSKIIKAYYGQSTVEQSFKNIKNPYHLAVTPGFHWTDHKIRVHYFTCVLGYLLSTLIWYEGRKVGFEGTLDRLLDSLNGIRLSQEVEYSGKQGKPKVVYQLEEMSSEQQSFIQALNLSKTHLKPLKIQGAYSY
jgi:transposase